MPSMDPNGTPYDERIVRTALTLIEREGWHALSLLALAKAAKVTLAELYSIAPDKEHLLQVLTAALDKDILAHLSHADIQGEPKDRVFDAVLSVFEALSPRKNVMQVLYHDLRRDPWVWRQAWRGLNGTSAWIADAAGLDTSGMAGALRVRSIALLLADTTPVWLKDGEDLGRTMAHVDRRLRLAQRWMWWTKSRNRASRPFEPAADDATDFPETPRADHNI